MNTASVKDTNIRPCAVSRILLAVSLSPELMLGIRVETMRSEGRGMNVFQRHAALSCIFFQAHEKALD
jgi:hypothetical protein